MNRYLNRLLRRDAAILRAAVEQGESDEELQERRRQMMEDVHRVLCICLGEPPLTFDFEIAVGAHADVDPSKVSVQEGAPASSHAKGDADAKPVRILRDKESYQHVTLKGLFPCGEGAGYAGGIVSAAIDGERCAEGIAGYLSLI